MKDFGRVWTSLQDFTQLYSIVLNFTQYYSILLNFTQLYSIVLNYTQLFSIALNYTQLYSITINDWDPTKTCLTLHSPVSKYQHDPSIQLGQSFRNKFFPSFRENGADEPQVKRVGCEGKYIGIRSCPILEWQARTSPPTRPFFFIRHTVKTALIMINKQASINIARKVIEKTVSLSPQKN